MKKYLISSGIILSFFVYTLYYRSVEAKSMPAVLPKSVTQTLPTTSPTATPSPTQIPDTNTTLTSPTDTPIPTATPVPSSLYKDGTFTGNAADAFYGMIQVQATISGGHITNIQFLQYPNDRGTSIAINQQADPMLAQEAISVQSANVNIISGATDSSQAFIESLQSALDKAKA